MQVLLQNELVMGYKRIACTLEAEIRCEVLKPGSRLPSERILAQRFGTQRVTVRRALTNLEDVGLVERLPHRGAVVCSGSKVRNKVALICKNSNSELAQSIASGMRESLGDHFVMPESPHFELNSDDFLPDEAWLTEQQIGAMVVMPEWFEESESLLALAKRIPTILVDRRLHGIDLDFVGADDVEAGRMAARCLLEAGHKRIGVFGVSIHETTLNRIEGVERELAYHGLDLHWGHLVGRYSYEGWSKAFIRQALSLEPRPTGIITTNEVNALRFLDLLRQSGRYLPGNFGIVSIAAAGSDVIANLNITAVELPFLEIGRVAAQLATSRLETPRESTEVIRLSPSLVRRRSTQNI